ncbi:MAG TPA: hypothetical protein VFU01_13995 [Gemmatimonadaceae bacterium]|nr:hypothetical protein [Gemmatimonadaceae bacterium]
MSILGIFVAAPWLALIASVLFGAAYWKTRVGGAAVAGALWLLYFLYEEGMRRRILCSGECNIRVDLLLIYPVLLGISIAAIIVARRRSRSHGAPSPSNH